MKTKKKKLWSSLASKLKKKVFLSCPRCHAKFSKDDLQVRNIVMMSMSNVKESFRYVCPSCSELVK